MRITLCITIAALVAISLLAGSTLGQLSSRNSYFLLSGQQGSDLTLINLDGELSQISLPPFSGNIPIQALTDIVNKRFLVLSGLEVNGGVNYTVCLFLRLARILDLMVYDLTRLIRNINCSRARTDLREILVLECFLFKGLYYSCQLICSAVSIQVVGRHV